LVLDQFGVLVKLVERLSARPVGTLDVHDDKPTKPVPTEDGDLTPRSLTVRQVVLNVQELEARLEDRQISGERIPDT